MKLLSRVAILAILAMGLSGCFERKRDITFNPDGTGKVVFEMKEPLDLAVPFLAELEALANKDGDNKKSSPEDKGKKAVEELFKNSTGVDAWENVSYEMDNNKLILKGTAYFRSFENLRLNNESSSEKNISVKVDSDGMLITWMKDEQKKAAGQPPELTEQELDEEVKQVQAKMKKDVAMMTMMLQDFRDEAIFHLPGKIEKINNIKQIDDNKASLLIEGKKILEISERFAEDTAAIRESVKQGYADNMPDSYFNQQMFGNDGESMVYVSGNMEPLFDYEDAVSEAKENFSEMCEDLGVSCLEQK